MTEITLKMCACINMYILYMYYTMIVLQCCKQIYNFKLISSINIGIEKLGKLELFHT